MPAKFRDYYQTLGVAKTASQDEIKSAFRKLARKHHPDTADDKQAAEEKFKEINEAYEVLGDPEKRRKYDEFGANWEHGASQPAPDYQWQSGGRTGAGGGYSNFGDGVEFEFGGTGFSDFFEQMFGARRGGFSQAGFSSDIPHRGSDVEADIMVTLEEAFHGSTRRISFRRGETGQVQTYTVKIPKGVRDGQRIRLAGQGGMGAAGGDAGDLFLRVRFQKHPDYLVEGIDLYREMEVPAWKCVIGGELEIPTLDGRARVKIATGSQSGRKLRLPGKGLPGPDGRRGDFFAVIVTTVPSDPSSEEFKLWKQIAELNGEKA